MLSAALLVAGCNDAGRGQDTAAVPDPPAAETAGDQWPAAGPIDLRRSRAVDFTGDGRAEQIIVTAHGTRYDSLDVALTITRAQGDTLWREAWTSLTYFNYDPREGKADSTVARIVRGHVDELLTDDRLSMSGGLPAQLRQSDPSEMMREAVRYHLAELDRRRAARLGAADETPPAVHSGIDARSIPTERVEAVIAELMQRPVFMYFAGGEATYAIGWSEREQAFVRLYSCC